MQLEKLRYGFMQVHTQAGLHYVKPRFWERLRLLWIFRNFSMLSQQVLNERERRFISSLCAQERMCCRPTEQERAELIGTVLMPMFPRARAIKRLYRCAPAPFDVRYLAGNVDAGQSLRKES